VKEPNILEPLSNSIHFWEFHRTRAHRRMANHCNRQVHELGASVLRRIYESRTKLTCHTFS